MDKKLPRTALVCTLLLVVLGCSTKSETTKVPPDATKDSEVVSAGRSDPLIGRIWRLPNSPYGAAAGSIYIFLANGTLLEVSCVETYRIATWIADKNAHTVHVVEVSGPGLM